MKQVISVFLLRFVLLKVVRREVCAVVTKGTLTEGEMLSMNPNASYLISLNEELQSSDYQEKSMLIGVCVADISTSRFIIGQVFDHTHESGVLFGQDGHAM